MNFRRVTSCRGTIIRGAIGLLAASGALVSATSSPAGAASCASSANKCFAVAPANQSNVVAGDSTTVAFTLTNEASTQKLGSAEIAVPAGFALTGGAISPPVPSGATVTVGTSSAVFLGLGLQPGGSITLSLTVTAPCSGVSGAEWQIYVKQSNQFNGPPGNDFVPYPFTESQGVTGQCSLAFSAEPTSVVVGTAIPSVFDTPASTNPVRVEVLDGNGALVSSSTAAITVALASNPGNGSLGGTTTESAGTGVASFDDLSINQQAPGYELLATSPGIVSAYSTPFTVYGSLGTCNAGCAASGSSKTTLLSMSSSDSSGFLGAAIGGQSFQCNGSYTAVSNSTTFDILTTEGTPSPTGTATVQLEILKSLVQASGHPGASSWQLCYLAATGSASFGVQPGTATTVTFGAGPTAETYTGGLLLDCSSSQQAPCVQARNKDNAGDVIITFLSAGDPVGRG